MRSYVEGSCEYSKQVHSEGRQIMILLLEDKSGTDIYHKATDVTKCFRKWAYSVAQFIKKLCDLLVNVSLLNYLKYCDVLN